MHRFWPFFATFLPKNTNFGQFWQKLDPPLQRPFFGRFRTPPNSRPRASGRLPTPPTEEDSSHDLLHARCKIERSSGCVTSSRAYRLQIELLDKLRTWWANTKVGDLFNLQVIFLTCSILYYGSGPAQRGWTMKCTTYWLDPVGLRLYTRNVGFRRTCRVSDVASAPYAVRGRFRVRESGGRAYRAGVIDWRLRK